ncbi:DUF1661 domain-containing protein [Porphyromonas gulae]|uniref:DUF1661 domain-containing protein n=1 Tax=Porphyromonas gulae TaxID=111105 RepID=UPI0012D3A666
MVREAKNSRAEAEKFSRHFFRKHAPQSDRFWFVFRQQQAVHIRLRGRWFGINTSEMDTARRIPIHLDDPDKAADRD